MSDSSWSPQDCSHQSSLSMGFPKQEYRSGLPFPSPICPIVSYNTVFFKSYNWKKKTTNTEKELNYINTKPKCYIFIDRQHSIWGKPSISSSKIADNKGGYYKDSIDLMS